MKRILRIAVLDGVENGIFQLVKVALSSVVALFGTYQIAANGIAQSIWSLAALAGVTVGPVFITVIGQCMGANDMAQAEYYFKKLLKVNLTISLIWNGLVFAITPVEVRQDVADILKGANPGASLASWAIRYSASLDGVLTVLSGISTMEMMEDNISYMEHFQPLTDAERAVLAQVKEKLESVDTIPCTGCRCRGVEGNRGRGGL